MRKVEKAGEDEKEVKRKGKKQRKKREGSKKWEKYIVGEDGIKRKNKFCPRCGPGVFLAEHADRLTCGGCGYTIFKERKS